MLSLCSLSHTRRRGWAGFRFVTCHTHMCRTHMPYTRTQEWRLYIIQEFADGGTLRRALDRGVFHDPHTGLPRMDALLDIAQGVAAALAHLHSKNVVHGDLNPKVRRRM